MQTRLVRVVTDETPAPIVERPSEAAPATKLGMFGRLASRKTSGWLEAAGATLSAAASSVIDGSKEDGIVQLEDLPISQARYLRDAVGKELLVGSVYARHPIAENIFVESEALHSYILNEQRSHIIKYFRSAVALKSLMIEIVSQKTGSYYASSGWIDSAIGRDMAGEQRRWFSATYSDPRKEPVHPGENLFWMTHFDEIVAATRDVAGGTIETSTSINMSFGLSSHAAKFGKINKNWLSQQSFVVKAEYA